MSEGWWVYMIRSRGGRLYTGISTDVERRFEEHASGRGARYFRMDPPVAVVYRESVDDRSIASRREAEIKKLSRPAKERLVASA